MGVENLFYIKSGRGECVIKKSALTHNQRNIVYGIVRSEDGTPAANAAVLIFDAGNAACKADYKLLEAIVTDDDGVFIAGPFDEAELYAVRIHKGGLTVRHIE